MSGALLQLAYRLRRHWWGGWYLSRWLGLVLVVVALLAWRCWPASATLGGVWLVYLGLLWWAGRRGYVRFVPAPHPEAVLQAGDPPAPLRAEERLPLRASGWFTVEGKVQYYVDLEADWETVETREHIVLARVHPSRFLWLGQWPGYELGWWYIFFQPAMLRQVEVGHLHFGPRPGLALRLVYAPDEETQQAVYLACDDVLSLRRVWDDLRREAWCAVRERNTNYKTERDEEDQNVRADG